ncbi:hypothetical protein Micbo1qcDRAFT_175443 [Microdochium bolleyi]|uniref:Uncharacterized protein n=1 Tax=Microdochium bolleyi TaxID=196109 RepID=A0A136J216_9PEZI|nr:hypothetical protein Micbo1qcDRAFT_175443 [Microdochium bolleyi]
MSRPFKNKRLEQLPKARQDIQGQRNPIFRNRLRTRIESLERQIKEREAALEHREAKTGDMNGTIDDSARSEHVQWREFAAAFGLELKELAKALKSAAKLDEESRDLQLYASAIFSELAVRIRSEETTDKIKPVINAIDFLLRERTRQQKEIVELKKRIVNHNEDEAQFSARLKALEDCCRRHAGT